MFYEARPINKDALLSDGAAGQHKRQQADTSDNQAAAVVTALVSWRALKQVRPGRTATGGGDSLPAYGEEIGGEVNDFPSF